MQLTGKAKYLQKTGKFKKHQVFLRHKDNRMKEEQIFKNCWNKPKIKNKPLNSDVRMKNVDLIMQLGNKELFKLQTYWQ